MKKITVKEIALCGVCAALMAVCSWIHFPIGPVSITLQTFAIFLTLSLLGGRSGTIAIAVYILLGGVGAPVFSGFSGGPGALFGVTGGYILGFLIAGVIFWVMELCFGQAEYVQLCAMVIGNLACYIFGTTWFMIYKANAGSPMGIVAVLSACVFPFILPDLVKIGLAKYIAARVKPQLQKL